MWKGQGWARELMGSLEEDEVFCQVNREGYQTHQVHLSMEHSYEAPTFPTFKNFVTSPVLEKPQVHNETHCQVSLVLFWVHLYSFSQSFTGWLRDIIWGWILGTLTDLSGWHKVGLISSENFAGFLVNLSSCLRARHGFCYSRTLWDLQVWCVLLLQVHIYGNMEGILRALFKEAGHILELFLLVLYSHCQ